MNNTNTNVISIFDSHPELRVTERENRFARRRTPWHQFGKDITNASTVEEALFQANMMWDVESKPIYVDGVEIPDFKANVRSSDNNVLGIVSDKYKIIQNAEAFSFADEMIKEGLSLEKAGTFGYHGSKVWLLGKLPNDFKIMGDPVDPYVVITTSHDGTGSLTVAFIPMRIACSNALNLALARSNRKLHITHSGNTASKIIVAQETLGQADKYFEALVEETEALQAKTIDTKALKLMVEKLLPMPKGEDPTERQIQNVLTKREQFMERYTNAPDIQHFGDTAYRFVNAASDFATHEEPARRTQSYEANLFASTVNGNSIIDKAFQIAQAA